MIPLLPRLILRNLSRSSYLPLPFRVCAQGRKHNKKSLLDNDQVDEYTQSLRTVSVLGPSVWPNVGGDVHGVPWITRGGTSVPAKDVTFD